MHYFCSAKELTIKIICIWTVTGSLAGSSIGVNMKSETGTFTSGYSTYNSGEDAAGIGGGYYTMDYGISTGVVNIYGGEVYAYGGQNAAGIGSGDGGNIMQHDYDDWIPMSTAVRPAPGTTP